MNLKTMLNAEKKIPDQAVTWSTDSLQSRQVSEEPHNLGSRIFSAFSQYLTIATSHFFIRGYHCYKETTVFSLVSTIYPFRDLCVFNMLA